MNNLQKFFEEVYRESKMLHLTEITVDKMIDAIHFDVGQATKINTIKLMKLKTYAVIFKRENKSTIKKPGEPETKADWYGKGNNRNDPETPRETFMQQLADAILQDFPNLDNHNQQELVKLALETWFGPSGTGDYTSDEIDSMWNRYNQTEHLF